MLRHRSDGRVVATGFGSRRPVVLAACAALMCCTNARMVHGAMPSPSPMPGIATTDPPPPNPLGRVAPPSNPLGRPKPPANPLGRAARGGNPLGASSPSGPAAFAPSGRGPRSGSEADVAAWVERDATGRPLRQWGNLIFPLAEGWRFTVDDGVAELRPDDWLDRDDFLEIRILPGEPVTGRNAALETWATARITAAYRDLDPDEPRTIEFMAWADATQTTGPRILLSGGVVREEDGDVEEACAIAVVKAAGHATIIIAAADEPQTLQTELPAFQAFVASVQFESLRGRPVLRPAAPGPLDDVYWGTRISYGMNLDATMRMDLVHLTYAFWPDGRFSEDIPPEGIDDFDLEALRPRYGDVLGHYHVVGDDLVLQYATGETETLEIEGDTLRDGAARLHPTELPPDGYRLDGTRTWMYYSGFAAMDGGIGAGGTIEFFPDGTYADSRWSSASGSFDGGGGFAVGSHNDDVRGRYEVRGGRVILRGPDDTVRSWTIHLARDDDTDEVDVWVGGEVLKR